MNEYFRLIIFTHQDTRLCDEVKDLLVSVGCTSYSGGNISSNVAGYRITGNFVNWSSEREKYRRSSGEFGDSEYPIKLDART